LTRSKFCSRDLTRSFVLRRTGAPEVQTFSGSRECQPRGALRLVPGGQRPMEIQNQKKFIRNYIFVIFSIPIKKSDGTVEKYDLLWRSDRMKHWVYHRVKPVFIEPETEYDQDWIEDHESPLVWVFLGMKEANRSQQVYQMIKSNEQIFKKSVHTSNCLRPKKKSPVLGCQQDL
jgi:hypothetical protein